MGWRDIVIGERQLERASNPEKPVRYERTNHIEIFPLTGAIAVGATGAIAGGTPLNVPFNYAKIRLSSTRASTRWTLLSVVHRPYPGPNTQEASLIPVAGSGLATTDDIKLELRFPVLQHELNVTAQAQNDHTSSTAYISLSIEYGIE